jgi:hypothetical protein
MENIQSNEIQNNSLINDIRNISEFKGISFSNYKKTDVNNQLLENINNGKLEQAIYWSSELICAGHFMDVWEVILHYTGKHIHLGNPKIIIYLQMRFEIFKSIISKGQFINEIDLRNNITIRKLFAEIISILTLSNKKHSFEPIKINKEEEFDMTQMTERLKADSLHYTDGILKKDDPKELLIAINEFSYHLSCSKSTIDACYWIEWIIDFDNICKKRKKPCQCQRRNNISVENRFQKDIIWIIWDVIDYYIEKSNDNFIKKLFDSLLDIFCIKYTTAACKRRRFLLYFAVALLTEQVPNNIELMPNKPMITNIVDKINEVYKQIKKNEISPNTEYLFSGIKDDKAAFERSMKKMDLVNSMDFGIN